MRLLCRYAGGLACLVTALALVACGGGPGSQPEPKQIEKIEFSQEEKARTISLSDKFNGSDLTYSATTSKRSVATVTVDNEADTLTVTAVGPGTATITVTAKNSQGEAKQDFTVTVPPAPDPEPVEFPDIPSLDKDSFETIPLGDKFSGENLTYDAKSSHNHVVRVTVDNTANTLTVTAVGPGQAIITVTATAAVQGSTPQTKTFTVTVPEAVSAETAPTVKTDAPRAAPVVIGAPWTVALSTVFDGATSYAATSSARTIATASGASSGTLTITGASAGSATITVTGTNTAGRTEHPITVTVTAAPAPTPPDTSPDPQPSATCKYPPAVRVTIDLGRTKKCTIPKLHTLNPDSTGVTTRRDISDKTGTVWLVTANNKGTHDITVHDGAGIPLAGKITVVVANSLPYLKPANALGDLDAVPTIPLTGTAHIIHPELSLSGDTTFHAYFDDPDPEDAAPFLYRIVDQPKWVLIETQDGFLVTNQDDEVTGVDRIKSSDTELRMEVLNAMKAGEEFTVSLVASDGSDESELPLVLRFTTDTNKDPRVVPYTSAQTENGALGKTALKVGPRRGVPHTLTFNQSSVPGFKFVADATLNTSRLPNELVTGAAALFYKTGSAILNADGPLPKHGDNVWAPGYHYYVLESSGAIETPRWTTDNALDGDPQVSFKLKESGSSGSITISYYVVYDKKSAYDTNNPEAATSATRIGSKSLTVTVANCSSPPDPVNKCP